jgi:hypothetical protein
MKIRYTIPEFCQLTGTSRSKTYERIRLRQIAVIKDGHQTFISHEEATRYATTSQPVAYSRATSRVA